MFSRDWRQREQNAKDRLAAQAEKRNDPVYLDRQRQLREMEEAQAARLQAERDRLRLEREGPVRAVVKLFRERFADDLPEIFDVLSKPAGVSKLLPHLKVMVDEDMAVRREAVEKARIEAGKAQIEVDAARRLAAHEKGEAKRKARPAAAQPEGEIEAGAAA